MPPKTRKAAPPTIDPETFTDDEKYHLQQAIKTVSEERLRELIGKLVRTEPGAEKELMKALVVTMKKRKRGTDVESLSRWETCAQCEVEYDVGEGREEGECRWHPGTLDPNWDLFEDIYTSDEASYVDTPETREDMPESFVWTCCKEDGTVEEGCQVGKHTPGGQKKRKL